MVLFWGSQDIYSNWHPCQFSIDGVQYFNVEQYMMAEKARLFGDKAAEQLILQTQDPRRIKALGRSVRGYDDARWAAVRMEVVERACLAKFGQNERLHEQLLATQDKTLVEASPVDSLWGIGLSSHDPRALDPEQWLGDNLLGLVLMKVRQQLRAQQVACESGNLF